MKTKDALNHFGGNSELTALLGLSTGAISQWGECPPDLRQLQIEKLSGGELKAEKNILPARAKKNSNRSKTFKAAISSSMDRPTASPFEWMGKSQAMAGVKTKSIKQIKQDAVRENPESSLGYATSQTNSFKAPR